MSPAGVETLINLLMLLALLAALTIWWATKHGGRRGRIAERARQAALTQRADSLAIEEVEKGGGFPQRLLRRLAIIGDRLPLFDTKYRLKLQKEMLQSG